MDYLPRKATARGAVQGRNQLAHVAIQPMDKAMLDECSLHWLTRRLTSHSSIAYMEDIRVAAMPPTQSQYPACVVPQRQWRCKNTLRIACGTSRSPGRAIAFTQRGEQRSALIAPVAFVSTLRSAAARHFRCHIPLAGQPCLVRRVPTSHVAHFNFDVATNSAITGGPALDLKGHHRQRDSVQ